jgi:hypothetical protein
MAASYCSRMTWRFVPPHAWVAMLVPFVWAHVPVGARLLVRGGDFSCKAETCRARPRLVVRGGDLLCEAETCRARRRLVIGGSSSGKLVGDASNWPKTGRLGLVRLSARTPRTVRRGLVGRPRTVRSVHPSCTPFCMIQG